MAEEAATPAAAPASPQATGQGQPSPAARAEVVRPLDVDNPIVQATMEDYGRAHPEAWPGPPAKRD